MKILERQATTIGGRDGIIKDTQSTIELKLAKPQEMGGKLAKGTNPEELFAMGYSSCFASSIEFLLQSSKQAYEDIEVTVTASLVKDGDSGFKFEALVNAKIMGVTKDIEKKYIEMAYQFCPYSKAIKGNVDIKFA
ncbi:MAG: Ohr family peroxiredoxin [Bacilli bacterium]|jgi:Ohr subfamily peroxiredoxin|nr:Ohr family peroxiredoxin [Acholeplasmataceae bacterium]MDD4194239.1 Ohr family peroxiredoxin [Acholeplasmataceae bacterium]MDY0338143.1 Ohr family peroxiredoxin [Acholeplasmataceae bacterium]